MSRHWNGLPSDLRKSGWHLLKRKDRDTQIVGYYHADYLPEENSANWCWTMSYGTQETPEYIAYAYDYVGELALISDRIPDDIRARVLMEIAQESGNIPGKV